MHVFILSVFVLLTLPLCINAGDSFSGEGELLYNGIRLPKEWPPASINLKDRKPRPIPYLANPPAVICIDVGRQLFVDDFLIERTDLARSFHYPKRYEKNPVLRPETELELNDGNLPCATLFNDGVWFDPKDNLFKMWYHAGWFDGTAYAVSRDGLVWERPELDVVKNTNRVLPAKGHGQRDGSAVWLDFSALDPEQRYKMFLYERPEDKYGGQVFTSPDGIHWSEPVRTPMVGDNTTIFFNPFRRKWIYSIRIGLGVIGRARAYREHEDLIKGAQWGKNEAVQWAATDELDLPDRNILAMMPDTAIIRQEAKNKGRKFEDLLLEYKYNYGDPPQLYNVDAIAYESIMLGVFNVLHGPANKICAEMKQPKNSDLGLAYSRDGFNWYRPDRNSFLAGTRKEGDWDRAYLHPSATICTVVGDRLYFYYGGWSGRSPKRGGHIYAGGATGVAFLRRDGFVSMDAGNSVGTLTTHPLTFKGKYMFVNLAADKGELNVEVLDDKEQVVEPFSAGNCMPISCDETCRQVSWKGVDDLSVLNGRKIRFRFQLRNGSLYAFWVTPSKTGASYGYVAAGGPGFSGPIDVGR